jgi:predicted benzoate:H+ symporter BenE
MTRDPAARPPNPIIYASNAAVITGIVLIVVGLFTATFVSIVGVFLLAVAIGLAMVNRSKRSAHLKKPPTTSP